MEKVECSEYWRYDLKIYFLYCCLCINVSSRTASEEKFERIGHVTTDTELQDCLKEIKKENRLFKEKMRILRIENKKELDDN